jgi:hypothetical protein
MGTDVALAEVAAAEPVGGPQHEARVEAVPLELAGQTQRRQWPFDLATKADGEVRHVRDAHLDGVLGTAHSHIDPDVIEGLCVRRRARSGGRRARTSARLVSLPDVIAVVTQEDISRQEEITWSGIREPEPHREVF